jgi:predicted nucleic acid-binding protein
MAGKRIFVDTHGFYVWADAADAAHGRAVAIVRESGRRFLTSEWVLVETVNLFVARRKPHWGERLFDFLRGTDAIGVVPASTEQFQAAGRLWHQYRDHPFPMTDCTSFAVMREAGIEDALTGDRHFRIMGFQPLLAD